MLSQELRPEGFNTWGKEPWDEYRARHRLPADEALQQFYRQVVYDHFDHFNEHYPEFALDDYRLTIEYFTARDVYEQVRFLNNQPADFWNAQYDQFKRTNQDYSIFQAMAVNKTPPFPPVLIDAALLKDDGWRVYGRPLHLIEGTHRTSYLRRMLELGEILEDSRHAFVVLRPTA